MQRKNRNRVSTITFSMHGILDCLGAFEMTTLPQSAESFEGYVAMRCVAVRRECESSNLLDTNAKKKGG
jgi:hypothetical protein